MKISIPNTVYVGFRVRDGELLGFLTPDGTDASAMKRRATVDKWRDSSIQPMTFTNDAIMGFKMVKSIQRYGWNGGNVVVRILDPRGFEMEITVANLLAIMEENVIAQGEIQTPCLWGRDGGKNYLIPTDSQIYRDAVAHTELKKQNVKKIPTNELKIGDTIRRTDGSLALYGGCHQGIDLNGVNYNSRSYHLYREIYMNRPASYVSRSVSSPAVEVVSSQDMDFETFLAGATLPQCFKLGRFSNPEIAFFPDGYNRSSRYSDKPLGILGDTVFFLSGAARGKEVVVKNGVLAAGDAVNMAGYAYAGISVTYDTPTGKQTFTFR